MPSRRPIRLRRPIRSRSAAAKAARLCAIGCVALALSQLSPSALAQAPAADAYADARNRMVDEEIVAAGVKDPRVIGAMRTTPRHEFVPPNQRRNAYYDMALPIGHAQTISNPFIVALMTEKIEPRPTDRVLEIGTGSGYQAAVLSGLVAEVDTIEIVEPLGRRAARTLRRLGYKNVEVRVGDGFQGWPEHAPYDKIIVTCSPEKVPQPLVDQLTEGGLMIIPVGERYQQNLYLMTKREGKLERQALRGTLFVPMTGAAEATRRNKPDPLNPHLVNGGFEQLAGPTDDKPNGQQLGVTTETTKQQQADQPRTGLRQPAARPRPAGWHYLRQCRVVDDPAAPDGRRYALFENETPGRGCCALQGFAVDGRQIAKLELSLSIRGQDIRPGQTARQLPYAVITFYDQQRAVAGHAPLGPWQGTFPWREVRQTLRVPLSAREAIFRVGLLGATGQLAVDNVELKKVEPKKSE